MLDIVIRGDQVVTPWGVGSYDVAIQGEKIVAVQSPGTLTGDVGRIIDATGKIVIPGGVEPHTHGPNPGHPDTLGLDEISRACVWGGTTTVTLMAEEYKGGGTEAQALKARDIFQAIEEEKSQWQGKCYADYSFHCMLRGVPSPEVISRMGDIIKDGFPCIKVFTTNIWPPVSEARRMSIGMGHISAIMQQVAAHGGILMVHAEDDDIVQYNNERLRAENRVEFHNLHQVHTNMSEDISFRRIIRVAEWMGTAIYLVHVSAKEGVLAIEEARGRGQPVYGETIPNYATFTAEDYKKPNGQKYHVYPSLKFDEDRLALWNGLIKGGLSCMATDEVTTTFEMKTKGKTIFDVVGGLNSVEARVGITYIEGVVKRGMSLRRFVDVVSTNAAKIMGLYPRKGAIAPGSDADIVFIDPNFHKKLTMDDLHISDYSIWEGWEVAGWPVFTMIRGKVMIEDRKLVGNQGHGQLVPGRKIDPNILRGPAC